MAAPNGRMDVGGENHYKKHAMRIVNNLKSLFLSGILLLLFSCGTPKHIPCFSYHHTLSSSVYNEKEPIVYPNHLIIERDLDSLDFEVQITPQVKKIKGETGVCVWVDGEHHADAVVFNESGGFWIQIRYVIDGSVYPICFVFASKKPVSIHVKRVGNDIVFYYPYDREITRIGLSYLFDGEYATEKEISLMMYAVHPEGEKPFVVDFDY